MDNFPEPQGWSKDDWEASDDEIIEYDEPRPDLYYLVPVDSIPVPNTTDNTRKGIVKFLLTNHACSTFGVFALALLRPEVLPLMVTYYAIATGALGTSLHLYFKSSSS